MECSIWIISDGSYIQNYFGYIIKKYEAVTDNSLIIIFVNKIENRITLKIKTDYLKFVTRETIKLLVVKSYRSSPLLYCQQWLST